MLPVLTRISPVYETFFCIHKNTYLNMTLLLFDTFAVPAVYMLSGRAPIECVIHKRALTVYLNICRLNEDSDEKQLARRQLSVKGYRETAGLWRSGSRYPSMACHQHGAPYHIYVEAAAIKSCRHFLVESDQEWCIALFQYELSSH